MIVVTGQPRCGTSMMMHCLHIAGQPLAFTQIERGRDSEKLFRNIYGFYEGQHNGQEGIIKAFKVLEDQPHVRYVVMTRSVEKMLASWKAIREHSVKKPTEQVQEEKRLAHLRKVRERIEEKMRDQQHIAVDYDTFVNEPETYRQDFNKLLPEIDFDILITGIDKDLYINR